MKIRNYILVFILAIICEVGLNYFITYSKESIDINNFIGKGTKEEPYQICSVEDLVNFRDLVNSGEDFKGKYIEQIENIDLSSIKNWIPIGIYGNDSYFNGTYNGTGHKIFNLNISSNENVGLFGLLGGTVINLVIESGMIKGACVGSIASHSASGSNAYIINCYNKASLNGTRAGGIADNFSSGYIVGVTVI